MDNKVILYNFASRSRPDAFFEVLDNIREMSATPNYIIIAKIDVDDPMLFKYTDRLKEYPEIIVMAIDNSVSKIHAINRNILETGWDILINISDDQRFTVKGFDDTIRQGCDSNTFLHFKDDYKRAACSVMSIMGFEYYKQVGYVFNPDYYSLWADTEATEVAKILGAYKYSPMVIARHLHYSTTGANKDALYKRNDTYKKDRVVYERRRANNLDYSIVLGYNERLLIKYPTRGRWRLFAEALDNLYSTIRTPHFRIVVSADTDDVEMNSPEVRELCSRYHNVRLVYGEGSTKIDACNRDMNLYDWDWCVLMSDDMRFTKFGWDYDMLKQIREVWPTGTDWFAHFNDGFVGEKLPTLNIVGREYYSRDNYLYHPSYKSVSCDAENMYVAQMRDRYKYFPELYFNHLHPANLKEPSDHVYRRNHVHGDADTENYFKRMRENFGLPDHYELPEELKQYV